MMLMKSEFSPSKQQLADIAKNVRINVIKAVYHAKGGHIGGPLSAVELLVDLYFRELKIDPDNPLWEDRDRFVLSKGHSAIALYSVLAERGFFPVSELMTFDAIDSRMQGHPDMRKTPGIDMSSGSLGQGLSTGVGMALAARRLKKDFRTYVMIGDGESQEGQIWEAIFVAERYKLDNLVAILDNNKVQQFGWQHPLALPPIERAAEKVKAFGWHAIEIDGHNFVEIQNAFNEAREVKGKPTFIIAHTIKGKGLSFAEGKYTWHARVPNDDELQLALKELNG
jgi:transketolase